MSQVCLFSHSLHSILSQKEAGKLPKHKTPNYQNPKLSFLHFISRFSFSLSLSLSLSEPCHTALHPKQEIRISIHGHGGVRIRTRREIVASPRTPPPNRPHSLSAAPCRGVPFIHRLAGLCLLRQFSPRFTALCN